MHKSLVPGANEGRQPQKSRGLTSNKEDFSLSSTSMESEEWKEWRDKSKVEQSKLVETVKERREQVHRVSLKAEEDLR